jgi:hypothetical protein
MRLVKECLRIIWECQYPLNGDQRTSNLKFWMIENPAVRAGVDLRLERKYAIEQAKLLLQECEGVSK